LQPKPNRTVEARFPKIIGAGKKIKIGLATVPLFLYQIIFMNYFLPIHNILRWAVLLFGLWALLNALTGVFSKRNYSGSDNKIGLFFMICCDIQLLIGLILYFNNSWFDQLKNNTSVVMKTGALRFFAMEHSLMMIIAWLLVHLGRSMVKRSDIDAQKHKRSLIYFGIALVIILAMIPWPFKQAGIARQLFPQF
jgi:hypothetical protein